MKIGRVYKIITQNDDQLVYLGSTTKSLAVRLSQHKYEYKLIKCGRTEKNLTVFKVFESGDCIIELLEDNIDKTILHQRERFYIDTVKCVNKNIPSRSVKEYKKEYYQLNKQQIRDYKKEYRQKHTQQIRDYQKEYRQTKKHCNICSRDYPIYNFARHLKSKKHIKNEL